MKSWSRVQLFVTPWTVAHRAPLSMEFFRQEYWSGLPFPSTWDLPNPGIEPASPAWQADSLPLMQQGSPNNASYNIKKKDGLTLVQGLTMFSGYPPDPDSLDNGANLNIMD